MERAANGPPISARVESMLSPSTGPYPDRIICCELLLFVQNMIPEPPKPFVLVPSVAIFSWTSLDWRRLCRSVDVLFSWKVVIPESRLCRFGM